MKIKKNLKFLSSLASVSLLLLYSCNNCPVEKQDINFGYYQSNSVEDDYIKLLPDSNYIHIVKSVNYKKSGRWIKGENCTIYLEQFSQVINKFDTTIIDSSKVGSHSFFLTTVGLETPEIYESYEYIGNEMK
ncbi:hypothetical protein [Nonlabens xiamenensis]|uniref:hypothetical protein n=1 Tax=Nonlabens xiamenensis TaxID=2341043 RepID=UPI000F608150|nr:hypothetical protein [Nonlabens xiamenensis]